MECRKMQFGKINLQPTGNMSFYVSNIPEKKKEKMVSKIII
jgi:type II secretory ATPase GspE/PulE/Tfp pilus assembly ATPase PilB-like protein